MPRNRGKNTVLLASLSLEGMGASMMIEGAADAAAFEAYLEHILVPSLHPGQLIVMDNLSAHKGVRIRQLIEDKGCQVLFLPAYSPDLSPIEEAKSCDQGLPSTCGGQDAPGPGRSDLSSVAHRDCPGAVPLMTSKPFIIGLGDIPLSTP